VRNAGRLGEFRHGRKGSAAHAFNVAHGVGTLLVVAGVIALGWKGRLPGARRA
jgi:hypothetical protein